MRKIKFVIFFIAIFSVQLMIAQEDIDKTLNGTFKKYFESGKLESVETLKSGLKEGLQIYYHPIGFVLYKVMYKDDEPHGLWLEFFSNGDTAEISYFNQGVIDGNSTQFYADGLIKNIGQYLDGEKVGVWSYYEPNGNREMIEEFDFSGQLIESQEYRNGRLYEKINWKNKLYNGEYLCFNANGKVKEQIYFKDGLKDGSFLESDLFGRPLVKGKYLNGQKEGLWEYFINYKDTSYTSKVAPEYVEIYQKGKLVSSEKTKIKEFLVKNGTGKHQELDSLGNIIYEVPIRNGVENGLLVSYFKGKKSSEVLYRNGKREGLQNVYFTDGSLQFTYYWRNGLKDSLFVEFSEQGDTIVKGYFNQGMKDSLWLFADKEGDLIMEGYYKDDLRIGEWLDYHKNGSVAKQAYYFANYLNGEYFEFHPNQKVSIKGIFEDGEAVDEWAGFDEKGELEFVGHYWKGEKEGVWKEYQDKKLVKEESFVDGYLHGVERKYFSSGKLEQDGFNYFGYPDSLWTNYYPNGQIASILKYDVGMLKDVVVMNNAKGKKISHGSFKGGTGELQAYYSTGAMQYKGNFKNGYPDGIWEFGFDNGKLKAKGRFVAGKKEGEWKFNDYKTGKLKVKGDYKLGEPIGNWKFYDLKGKEIKNVNVDDKDFILPF